MKIAKITSEKEYRIALSEMDIMLKKPHDKLTKKEHSLLDAITDSIELYESAHYKIDMPKTIAGWIELKMFEKKLKQRELAKLLEINEVRLSEVLNGKRKVNIDLAKRLYQKLEINATTILELA